MTAPTKTGEVGTFPMDVVHASSGASVILHDLGEQLVPSRRGVREFRISHYRDALVYFDRLAKSMEVIRAHVASEGVR